MSGRAFKLLHLQRFHVSLTLLLPKQVKKKKPVNYAKFSHGKDVFAIIWNSYEAVKKHYFSSNMEEFDNFYASVCASE